MNWSYLLTGFDGRISRQPFWIAFGSVVAAEIALHLVALRIDGERLAAIVDLAFIYPEFAICAKRAHDRDIRTWWIGAFFATNAFLDLVTVLGIGGTLERPNPLLHIVIVPWMIFGLVLLVDLGFRRGTQGPNRFGPDPLAPSSSNRGP